MQVSHICCEMVGSEKFLPRLELGCWLAALACAGAILIFNPCPPARRNRRSRWHATCRTLVQVGVGEIATRLTGNGKKNPRPLAKGSLFLVQLNANVSKIHRAFGV